jgi:hypothetical protein
MRTQLYGEIMFGLTATTLDDFSDEVSVLTIDESRQQVGVPPTYGVPRAQTRLGAEDPASVGLTFHSDESVPTGLWALMRDAFKTDSGDLYFSAKYNNTAAGASNPRFTGIISVATTMAGTAVGEWKQQARTFPGRDVEMVETEYTGS